LIGFAYASPGLVGSCEGRISRSGQNALVADYCAAVLRFLAV
jgi:hypothetical protein